MRSGTQSNPAPAPRGVPMACPAGPPVAAIVAAFPPAAEENFAPRVVPLLYVADLFPHKMTNYWRSNVAQKIRREYIATIHRDYYVQPTSVVGARNLLAQRGHSPGNAFRRVRRNSLSAHVVHS